MATLKSLEIDVAAIFDVNRFGANYRSEQESDKSRRCSDAEAHPTQRRVPDCVIMITACGDDKPTKQPYKAARACINSPPDTLTRTSPPLFFATPLATSRLP